MCHYIIRNCFVTRQIFKIKNVANLRFFEFPWHDKRIYSSFWIFPGNLQFYFMYVLIYFFWHTNDISTGWVLNLLILIYKFYNCNKKLNAKLIKRST